MNKTSLIRSVVITGSPLSTRTVHPVVLVTEPGHRAHRSYSLASTCLFSTLTLTLTGFSIQFTIITTLCVPIVQTADADCSSSWVFGNKIWGGRWELSNSPLFQITAGLYGYSNEESRDFREGRGLYSQRLLTFIGGGDRDERYQINQRAHAR